MAAHGRYARVIATHEPDWNDVVAARIYDPLWLLARQRELGEYRGENATTPVLVSIKVRHRPLTFAHGDPTTTPAEALVEADVEDWWTMGRRIRIGQQASAHAITIPTGTTFVHAPPPYEAFTGQPDGLELWRRRSELQLTQDQDNKVFGEVPTPRGQCWSDHDLVFEQRGADDAFLVADSIALRARRHPGGPMDWYSADAKSESDPAPELGSLQQEVVAAPVALSYPGQRTKAYFEFEDPATDLGAVAPDAAHPATAILTAAIHTVSQEWFGVPVRGYAGNICTIESINVTDSFDRQYTESAWQTHLGPPKGWSLFHTDGLAENDLVLWQVAQSPLQSNPIERVQFGVDEGSNLVWAVERIVDGRTPMVSDPLPDPMPERINAGAPSGDLAGPRPYVYLPGTGAEAHWIPYALDDDDALLVQRRLVDLSRTKPALMPIPQARVLDAAEKPHRIHPSTIPGHGMEIERRWILSRDSNGKPVLWCRRQRVPRLSPPARRLRFDVTEPIAEP